MKNYLSTAISAVEKAAYICQKVQRQLVTEDTLIKKDRSPVTVADYTSQAVICRTLKNAFPQMAIVAEEDAQSLRKSANGAVLEKIQSLLPDWTEHEILESIDAGKGESAAEFWTLDPIDGTKGFLRGDQYAVALALIRKGQPVLGVLGCPNLHPENGADTGTLFYAVQGQGTYFKTLGKEGTTKVQASKSDGSGEVRFLESVESGHANHDLQSKISTPFAEKAKVVRYDSQVKYAVLARGEADVYLRLPNPASPDYREKIWDHAAGVAIIQEAGGRVSDMFGKTLNFTLGRKLLNNRGVVVSNGKMHEQIIALIKANY